jgi:hypothetical protein
LIDGRNRLRACELADVEPIFKSPVANGNLLLVERTSNRGRKLAERQLPLADWSLALLDRREDTVGLTRKCTPIGSWLYASNAVMDWRGGEAGGHRDVYFSPLRTMILRAIQRIMRTPLNVPLIF